MKKFVIFFKSNWPILSILFLAAAVRSLYAFIPLTQISPDESTYGLAALHWLKGTDYPVFYYAQPYTGTLSAIISAGLMRVFGVAPFWLKLMPLLCSIAFVYTNYLLGKRIFSRSGGPVSRGERIGLLAALLTALASPFFLNWSSRAGSGYPEVILVGNLTLLLILKLVYPQREEGLLSSGGRVWGRLASYFFLGLLLGLGFWIQPTIVYYALPGLGLLFLWRPWLLFTLPGWVMVLGAVIGSGPVIYFNIVHGAVTTSALFHDPWGIRRAAGTFWSVGFPIIAGLRASWSTTDFFLPLSVLIYILYIGAGVWSLGKLCLHLLWEGTFGAVLTWGKRSLAFVVAPFVKLKISPLRNLLVSSPDSSSHYSYSSEIARVIHPQWLIWGVFVTTWVVFSLSGQFGQFIIEPRYILSLYTVLPLLMADFLVGIPVPHKIVRWVLIGLVLFSQVIGVFVGGKNTRPSTFFDQYSLKPLITYLRSHNLGYVYADEQICHRLIFESSESIICIPISESFTSNRYPVYKDIVRAAPKEQLAYIRVPGLTYQIQECLEDLSQQSQPCRHEAVGDFNVYFYTELGSNQQDL